MCLILLKHYCFNIKKRERLFGYYGKIVCLIKNT